VQKIVLYFCSKTVQLLLNNLLLKLNAEQHVPSQDPAFVTIISELVVTQFAEQSGDHNGQIFLSQVLFYNKVSKWCSLKFGFGAVWYVCLKSSVKLDFRK